MTWSDALEAWRRIDGTLFFGVAIYLYLSRRSARRKLARAEHIIGSQEASIQFMMSVARLRGIILSDPRESAAEPQSIH